MALTPANSAYNARSVPAGVIARAGADRPAEAASVAYEAVRLIDLDGYAAQGYPDLLRGMVVTVERPWSSLLSRPTPGNLIDNLLAWRIRANTDGRASHAMIYTGGGKCLSQDHKFEVVQLSDYRGCILRFWEPPSAWTWAQRNELVAEGMVRFGSAYSYQGILAQLLKSKTGDDAWTERLDEDEDICSEAVCELVRLIESGYLGPLPCHAYSPAGMEIWMLANGWTCLALRIG